MIRMEAKYPEITLGEIICERIKIIYFSDVSCSDSYKQIAKKFTEIKQIMHKFYSDKTNLEILLELRNYSDEDLKDAFNLKDEPCVTEEVKDI